MTHQQILNDLGITALCEAWAGIYETISGRVDSIIEAVCDIRSLREIMDRYSLFEESRYDILAAAEELRNNRPLSRLTAVIAQAIESPDTYDAGETELPFGNTLPLRFYILLPIIHKIPQIVGRLKERSIPDSQIRANLGEYEGCLRIFKMHNGFTGFDKRFYGWTKLTYYGQLFRIGRLNFEIGTFNGNIRGFQSQDGQLIALADNARLHISGHILGSAGYNEDCFATDGNITETADSWIGYPAVEKNRFALKQISLNKRVWLPCLKIGDSVINVHIPRDGALTRENCLDAFREARQFFRQYYPDCGFKAFVCKSWMMSTQLKDMLPPSSHILTFQQMFTSFPIKASGQAVFRFVYQFPNSVDISRIAYDSLNAQTSLQFKIKEMYTRGDILSEEGGFFVFDMH